MSRFFCTATWYGRPANSGHPCLLPEEKVPSIARRMRRCNRNGRNPPHPAGFAAHTSLLPEEKVLDRSEADEVVLRD